MTYTLQRLAPGSLDVLRDGEIVASLVSTPRRGGRDEAFWSAELLRNVPAAERPEPFTAIEHRFHTLGEACVWLSVPYPRETSS
jgi:hypothetical protein